MHLNELWPEARIFERLHDTLLVVGTECFDSDTQLNSGIAVGGNELIVIETYHVAVAVGDGLRDAHQFARAIRQENRNGEDSITLDQAMLDD